MRIFQNFVTVYFVRHGETVGNLKRVVLPPTEDVLSDEGKRQAKLLGEFLRSKGEVFTAAFSSTYDRCLQTTDIILKETGSDEANVTEDARIREVYMGKYEGGSFIPLLKDLFSSGHEDLLDWAAEGGGETRAERRERMFGFLKDFEAYIDQKADSLDTILVASHGACLYQMYQEMLNVPEKFNFLNWRPEYNLIQKNTGFFKIKIEKNPKAGEARKLDVEVGLGTDHLDLQNDTLYKLSQTPDGKTLKGCIQQ